jgi:hypothetical protein
MRRQGAVAEHDDGGPWPEEVVVEDEEAGDTAEAVEGPYLVSVPASDGRR